MPPIRVAFVISSNNSSPRGGARTGVGNVDSFHAPTWGSSAVYTPLQSGYTPLRGAGRYQQGRIRNGRSPQNCMERGCVSVRPSDAILRDDELICFAHH